MRIRLAKNAGFCMGVRRAVDMALDLQTEGHPKPIVTYGPLIHNPQTLELLRSRGIEEADSLERITTGTVVIRAHGISPDEKRILKEKGVTIVDATCPRVAKVQAVIGKYATKGCFTIIVGDADHPEVKGLLGFAKNGGTVIASAEDVRSADSIDSSTEICVVAQTTQEPDTFDAVVAGLKERFSHIHVYNTICDSTKKRQEEVRRLAGVVDTIVVVGGRGSGNTRRLVKVAQAHGAATIHVETAEEIPRSALFGADYVGVTAGASTPNWQIQAVISKLKQIGMSSGAGPLRRLRRLFDIAVMTYIWAAAAGGGLTAASLTLQGKEITWPSLVLTMLFVFSMHLLNRTMDQSGAVRFNTPEIAAFYARNRGLLSLAGGLASLGALSISLWLGLYPFLLLAAMFAGGLIYTVPAEARFIDSSRKWRSLKDIPGSKTMLVALGWGMAAVILPACVGDGEPNVPGVIVSYCFASGLVFWRTALSDLLDIQGDRIVGRETIPILLGAARTRRLLKIMLVILGACLVGATAVGWVTSMGYVLVLNTLIFGLYLFVHIRGQLVDRLLFECFVDANLLLAGGLSMVYGIVMWR
ncbi:MAG: 4-hydroxy-3-methylbut-2-enyl diphosphate reductase [Pseudomonadota bacterium]